LAKASITVRTILAALAFGMAAYWGRRSASMARRPCASLSATSAYASAAMACSFTLMASASCGALNTSSRSWAAASAG